MKRAIGIILMLGASTAASGATVETAQVTTPRGVKVNVQINAPDGLTGKAPAVVIAPGRGYPMQYPIIQQLAESLAASGIIAFRFNWNYYSQDPQNGQPSADLSKEVEDMQTVATFAKADARVDAARVVIGGKSLGSVVSYKVFQKDPSVVGSVLMTPICTSGDDTNGNPLPKPVAVGSTYYPGLASESRPVMMMLGNSDPNCSVPMLYDFLKDSKGNISTVVVGGDHSWDLSDGTDPVSERKNSANIAAGVAMAAHWIDLFLGR